MDQEQEKESNNTPPPPPPTVSHIGLLCPMPKLSTEDPEAFSRWKQQIGYFLRANNITDPVRMKQTLVLGSNAFMFNMIQRVCLPESINDCSYETIMERLSSTYGPKPPNQWVARCNFYKRCQLAGEPFRDYLLELRVLAKDCNFPDEDDRLLVQIIRGIFDHKLQEKLVFKLHEKDDPKLSEFIDMIDHDEQIKALFANMQGRASNSEVHYNKQRLLPRQAQTSQQQFHQPTQLSGQQTTQSYTLYCGSCAGNHPRDLCKYRNATCTFCSKRGHVEPACFFKRRGVRPAYQQQQPQQRQNIDKKYKEGPHSGGRQHSSAAHCLTDPSSSEDEPETPVGVLSGVRLFSHTPPDCPLSGFKVLAATKEDTVLAEALRGIEQGWPEHPSSPEFEPYLTAAPGTFTVLSGCIIRGSSVVIPVSLRPLALSWLHRDHLGIARTKSMARSYVWWPEMDQNIEQLIKSCVVCGETSHVNPPRVPVNLSNTPSKVWTRVHLDYAGPFHGRMVLIAVDATSQWVEVVDIKSPMDSKAVISALRFIISREGYPDQIVTAICPALTSPEFIEYLKACRVQYKISVNGDSQAEMTGHTVKNLLEKFRAEDWELRLMNLLFTLRTTPSPETGKTPGELMRGRRLSTLQDRLNPDNSQPERSQRDQQDAALNTPSYGHGASWLPGPVEGVSGDDALMRGLDGQLERCQLDQVRPRVPSQHPEQPGPAPESQPARRAQGNPRASRGRGRAPGRKVIPRFVAQRALERAGKKQ